jgi:seryl-tRNA synthetase
MKFTLEGEVLFSREADEALDDIANFIEEAIRNCFLRE